MNKSDYDKYYKKGGTYVIPVELFNELFDELERLSFNYEQALEDLDKKDNTINELENEFDSVIKDPLIHMCYKRLARKYADKLQELKGENNDK